MTTAPTRCVVGFPCQQLCILDRAEHADAVEAGQRRPDRRCARAQDECVVGKLPGRSAAGGAHRDVVPRRVYGDDLGADTHVQTEPVKESIGRLEQQIVLVLYHAADEVRQPAIGVGDMARALQHDDRRFLVQTTQSGGSRHPSRHPTNDHDPAATHAQASFMNMRWTS